MRTLLCLAGLLALPGTLAAQGCSQCRDTVSQSNPAVQRSYRDAIGLMLGAVIVVGSAGIVVIRRFR